MPLELVYKYRTDSHLLTPAAFRFYFPAFLIGGILQAEYDDKYVDDGLVYLSYRLIPPETASPEMERFLDNISGFSLQQKKVAKKFMQLFLETNPYHLDTAERAATNNFWDNLGPD